MHILYIEDDIVDQITFRRLLKKYPQHQFNICSNLEEGLHALSNTTFDLVVSDFYLGSATIFEVVDAIPNYPIFVVSSLSQEEIQDQIKDLTVEGSYSKPIDITFLQLLEQFYHRATKKTIPKSSLKSLQVESSSEVNQLVNYDYLDQLSNGSSKIKLELLEIFVDVVSTENTNIQLHLKDANFDGLAYSFHRMKSNLRMLGMTAQLQLANELEQNARDELSILILKEKAKALLLMTTKAVRLVQTQIKATRSFSRTG